MKNSGTGRKEGIPLNHFAQSILSADNLQSDFDFYNKLFLCFQEGILILDSDLRVVFINSVFLKTIGYSQDEVSGESIMRFLKGDSQKRTEELIKRNIDTVSDLHTAVFLRKNGTEADCIIKTSPFIGQDGSFTGAIVTLNDFTGSGENKRRCELENSINKIISEFYIPLTDPSVVIFEFSKIILKKAMELTGSHLGFVTEIDRATGENNILSIEAADGLKKEDLEKAKKLRFMRNSKGAYTGLLGLALNTGESFFTNSPSEFPGAKGFPIGHIPVNQMLAVPVKLASHIAGEIILANPGRDYNDDDLYTIKRLAEFLGLAIHQRKAQGEMEYTELKNRILLDTAIQFTYELERSENGEFRLVEISDSFIEFSGYGMNELSTKDGYKNLFYPDDYRKIIDQWVDREKKDEAMVTEYRIITRYGKVKWVKDFNRAIWDDSRKYVKRIFGAVQDIGDEKEIAERLKGNEELLLQVLNSSPNRIYVKNSKGKILFANRKSSQVYGVDIDHIIGKTIIELAENGHLKMEEARVIDRYDMEASASGEPLLVSEESMTMPDGRVLWFRTQRIPIFYKDEVCMLGISMDITQLREQEEELGRQLERYEDLKKVLEDKDQKIYDTYYQLNQIFNSSPVGMCLIDKEYNVYLANESYCRIIGVKLKDALGKKCYQLFRGPQCFTEDCALRQVLHGKKPDDISSYRERFDETTVPCYVITRPFYDIHSELIGVISSYQDITEILKAQEELKNKELQLLQSQKMEAIGRLAGGIAHDFNNLLTIIKGYTELLLYKAGEKGEMSESLNEVLKASTSASSLTGQLLAFSRKQILDFKVLDINIIIQDMQKMLQRMLGENIEISLKLSKGIGYIHADRSQIEQIIMNLAVNARDALPQGGSITIATGREYFIKREIPSVTQPVSGEFISFSLTDNGVGISQEMIGKIFEPFFTTKRPGEGTGLGLPTVFGIVKQHEGFIHVMSEPGFGTSFVIYLPLFKQTGEAEEQKKEKKKQEKGNGELVMVVEDEKALALFASRLLEENHYKVIIAENISQAMEIFDSRKNEIRLVFTDLVLTDGMGMDLISYIKSMIPEMPVIATSGYVDKQIDLSFFSDQGIPFLKKPYEVNVFVDTVFRMLHDSKTNP